MNSYLKVVQVSGDHQCAELITKYLDPIKIRHAGIALELDEAPWEACSTHQKPITGIIAC